MDASLKPSRIQIFTYMNMLYTDILFKSCKALAPNTCNIIFHNANKSPLNVTAPNTVSHTRLAPPLCLSSDSRNWAQLNWFIILNDNNCYWALQICINHHFRWQYAIYMQCNNPIFCSFHIIGHGKCSEMKSHHNIKNWQEIKWKFFSHNSSKCSSGGSL